MILPRSLAVLGLFAALLQCGCGGGANSSTPPGNGSPVPPSINGIPRFSHVLVVLEENHSFGKVIGSPNMPYLNGLVSANGLATQYYANAHPSLPNYFMLTVGSTLTGGAGGSFDGTSVSQDNVVRALTAAGKTWKFYGEDLPSPGYLGIDVGNYAQDHNPFVFFTDVLSSTAQAANIVPFTQFATDLAANNVPDYSFISPSLIDDAHGCPTSAPCDDSIVLANADQWLKTNIGPLLTSAAFKNSLLVVVFDEGDVDDLANGGGLIPAVFVSPLAKSGYQSTTVYQHQSTLRLMLEGLGVTDMPGDAATAPEMSEFFK